MIFRDLQFSDVKANKRPGLTHNHMEMNDKEFRILITSSGSPNKKLNNKTPSKRNSALNNYNNNSRALIAV